LFLILGGAIVAGLVLLLAGSKLKALALSGPLAAATVSPAQVFSAILPVLIAFMITGGLFYLAAYSALLTGTARIGQGREAGIISSIVGGLANIKSLAWIMLLHMTAGLIFGVSLFLLMIIAKGSAATFLVFLLACPLIFAANLPFVLAPFVYLDQDIRGLRAISVGWDLVRDNWPRILWRFIVFALIIIGIGIAVGIVSAIIRLPILGSLVSLFFSPGIGVIFPWLLYRNLKAMQDVKTVIRT
jgi:hypothetical protein